MPVFTPEVAESETVFSVPVVRPTVLFVAPVMAFAPWPMTPGFLATAGLGTVFCAETGVGFVPSGFTDLTAVFFEAVVVLGFTGVAFEGVLVLGLTGVALVVEVVLGLRGVALEVEAVLGLRGVEAVVAVAVAFEAGMAAFLMLGPWVRETGRVFCVPRAVRGFFEAALVGVVLLTAVGLAVTGAFFTAGVPAGVAVAGVALVAAGVARTSFAGAFLTGVAPVFAATGVEEAGVVFFTGVAFGVVTVGFFATFSIPLTPAMNKGSALQDVEDEKRRQD
jgi:hypothetical protein